MIDSRIHFGEAFRGAETSELRQRLASLVGSKNRPVFVDSVLSLADELEQRPAERRQPGSYVLFDPQHVYLYDEPADASRAGIDSLIRFLLEGYPSGWLELAREKLGGRAFQFLHPLEALDILPCVWPTRVPGEPTILCLDSAEIRTSTLVPHPETYPRSTMDAETARVVEPPPMQLRDRPTDASLRGRPAPAFQDLVDAKVGVVRRQILARDRVSMPFATTVVRWNRGRREEYCHGKGSRETAAAKVAVCEALERFQVIYVPPAEELIYGTHDQLRPHAVDPRRLFFGGTADGGGHLPAVTSETAMYWTWADHPCRPEPRLVPAQEIWFQVSRPEEPKLVNTTTNGCALGGSMEEAGLFALLEAVERDSFLTAWYLRRPCRRIAPESVEDEAFQVLRLRWQLAFPGYELYLFDIMTDLAIPAVAAVALRREGDGPYLFLAAAARLTTAGACRSVLEDLSGFSPELTSEQRQRSRSLLESPQKIKGPPEHFSLFACEEVFERLHFLGFDDAPRIDASSVDRRALIPVRDRYDLRQLLEQIVEHAETRDVSVLLKDISHPSLAARGLVCAKALTPGLYPMWFGYGNQRFAMTDRLRRLAEELCGRSLESSAECNLEIHPFT